MVPLPHDTIEEMRKAPSAAFESPGAVLDDGRLDDTQRRQILQAWLHDCRELAVADGEGMALGARSATRLQEVEDALVELEARQQQSKQ